MSTRASTFNKPSSSPTRPRNHQATRRRRQQKQQPQTTSSSLQQRQDAKAQIQQQQVMPSKPHLPPASLKEPFQSRNPAPEGKSTGGLKLDLNLDVEVQVNARVHGDLTLAIF